MRVAAPAERGRANEAVLALVANAVGLSLADVSLVAGAAARDKVVRVEGLRAAEVDRRLASSQRRARE